MAIATKQSEYLRLRSYLNPAIKGPNTDAVLQSLATASSYLVNSVYSVNQNLFITTASAQYLDLLLSQYGITRPPQIGISDDSFRQIGLQVKNRKQVRDLINNLLDAIFGDELCKATNSASTVEPYNLTNPNAFFVGLVAGMTSNVTISATSAGSAGNTIVLSFNGTTSILTAITTWNAFNPTNQASFDKGDGTQIPFNSTFINLSGAGSVPPDTLIISFDGGSPVTIPFQAANFTDITAASAIEVADAIVSYLNSQGLTGLATTKNNGLGNYVELVSSTIGPRSSVTVLGGSAQNILLFPSSVNAGGNASTQWTLSVQSDGNIRFTWTGGANPNLGKLAPGNYVNIYGGGFASSTNVGTFTIVEAVGGLAGSSYFDVYNPIGTTGIVVQGTDTAVLFFDPIKETIQSKGYYAALYQTGTNILQIFLPATTQVVVRSRKGSAHLHYPPNGNFTFNAQPNSGDSFDLTSGITLVAGTDFVIGATIPETVSNMVNAINNLSVGMVGIINSNNIVYIQNDSLANILTITYTGSANIVGSGPMGDNISLEPNQPGPYMYDTTQPFSVGAVHSILTQDVNASTGNVILVKNSSGFPDGTGYVVFDYGGETQEIANIIAVPSNTSILLSPVNSLQYDHPAGQEIRTVINKSPVVVAINGSDYDFVITDVVGGRTYCQDLIEQVVAAGISLVFTILYPADTGLGGAGTSHSEIKYVYGPDPKTVQYPVNDLGGT
jgi:hypothetical protein